MAAIPLIKRQVLRELKEHQGRGGWLDVDPHEIARSLGANDHDVIKTLHVLRKNGLVKFVEHRVKGAGKSELTRLRLTPNGRLLPLDRLEELNANGANVSLEDATKALDTAVMMVGDEVVNEVSETPEGRYIYPSREEPDFLDRLRSNGGRSMNASRKDESEDAAEERRRRDRERKRAKREQARRDREAARVTRAPAIPTSGTRLGIDPSEALAKEASAQKRPEIDLSSFEKIRELRERQTKYEEAIRALEALGDSGLFLLGELKKQGVQYNDLESEVLLLLDELETNPDLDVTVAKTGV